MEFTLANEQREALGIEPLDSKWEILELNDFAKIYLDSDNIIRRLISYERGYMEREYNIRTENRINILPLSKSGKPKKLSYATVLNGPKPINVGMTYWKDHCVSTTNFNVDRDFINSRYSINRLAEQDLSKWVNDLCNSMTDANNVEIEEFKNLKRKKVKYIPGDIFTYRIDLNTFGYGQILLDINKIRKEFVDNNNASLGKSFGASVLARIFCLTSTTKAPPIEAITSSKSLPSFILRDNSIFTGEYEIIGRSKLENQDFDFPISFGLENNVFDPFDYLHIGFVTLKQLKEKTPIEFREREGFKAHDSPYRNNSSFGMIPYTLPELKGVESNDMSWFWDNISSCNFQYDLRNPKNQLIKDKIFKHFDLEPNWSYEEIRMSQGVKSTLEVLNSNM